MNPVFVFHSRRRPRSLGRLLLWLSIAVISFASCRDRQEPAPPPDVAPSLPPLRVLVVDDPPLAEAIERQWLARAEGPIQILQTASAELLGGERRGVPADAVIYPGGLLGELVERAMLTPLPDSELNSSQFARRDVFDLIRQREIAWGKQVYAVPLGSPVLTLIYRRDVFDALNLQPPTTWEEYAALLGRLGDPAALGDLAPADAERWTASIEPLAEGWASQILLARAAGYARHRNYFSTLFDATTMTPLIDGPAFVRALEELVAADLPSAALEFGPEEARREILAGRCAMCLSWPSGSDSSADPITVPLAFAELPGSREVYEPRAGQWQTREAAESPQVTLLGVAGRLGSVSSMSRQPQAAARLLINLSSREWSDQVSPFSSATTLYRDSQLGMARAWMGEGFDAAAAREYGELVRQMQRRSLWMFSPRIPGRTRYLAALDEAVHRALKAETPPAAALAEAARQWQAITDELGVDRQRAAYVRSQGLEP